VAPSFYLSINLPDEMKDKVKQTAREMSAKAPKDDRHSGVRSRFTPEVAPHMTFLFFGDLYDKLDQTSRNIVDKLVSTSIDQFPELHGRQIDKSFTYKQISLFNRFVVAEFVPSNDIRKIQSMLIKEINTSLEKEMGEEGNRIAKQIAAKNGVHYECDFCPICIDAWSEDKTPCVFPCGHLICNACVDNYIPNRNDTKCPHCIQPCTYNKIFKKGWEGWNPHVTLGGIERPSPDWCSRRGTTVEDFTTDVFQQIKDVAECDFNNYNFASNALVASR